MAASDEQSFSTTAGSDLHITFNIHGTKHVAIWAALENTRTFLGETSQTLDDIIVPVNSGGCSATQLLHQHLSNSNWPLPDTWRWSLTDMLLADARERLESTPNTAQLDFHIHIYFRHNNDENMLLLLSMEDSGGGMTPATESVIKSLEKRTFRYGGIKDCSICMEKMNGDVVIQFPCTKHDFHKNCIERWLRTSHSCPICRFEMSTG